MNTELLQFRLFHLVFDEKELAQLRTIGANNFSQSIQKEQGTLAMLLGSNPERLNDVYVVELYQDEQSYQEHIASEHFKAFADFAQKNVIERNVVTLQPELLLEKAPALFAFGQDVYTMIITEITTQPLMKEAIIQQAKHIIVTDDNVLAIYIGSDELKWTVIEIKKNQSQSSFNFNDATIQSIILSGDMLVNQNVFSV